MEEAVGDPSRRESEASHQLCSTERFQVHHIKIMKVALALAIIRQKPAGLSAREYTERLAAQFSHLQVDWKDRARQLEQELLRSRQELVKYQIEADEMIDHTHTKGALQWSDSECQSSGYSSSIHTTSQEREPQMVAHSDQRCNKSKVTDHNIISAHVKFLSSVSSALDTRQHLSVLAEADVRTAVRDTLLQVTRGLGDVLSKSRLPTLPSSLNNLEKAIQTIVDAVLAPRMQPFHAEMADACNDLLKTLTARISLHQDTRADSEVLCSLVCALGSVPTLYCNAVQQLISAVLECAEMMSRSTQDVALFDVGSAESVSAVFTTLEALFTKYDTSALPQHLRLDLYDRLERAVLGVTRAYPLFTFSVWRVLAHLTPSNR